MKKSMGILCVMLLVFGVVGIATSVNATLTWTKYGSPVLDLGAPSEWDSLNVHAPSVMFDEGIYKMWYSARDAGHYTSIGYAESSDGINWSKWVTVPGKRLRSPCHSHEYLIT